VVITVVIIVAMVVVLFAIGGVALIVLYRKRARLRKVKGKELGDRNSSEIGGNGIAIDAEQRIKKKSRFFIGKLMLKEC
jgi:membrane protein implicated in regulation of membrane protease activity